MRDLRLSKATWIAPQFSVVVHDRVCNVIAGSQFWACQIHSEEEVNHPTSSPPVNLYIVAVGFPTLSWQLKGICKPSQISHQQPDPKTLTDRDHVDIYWATIFRGLQDEVSRTITPEYDIDEKTFARFG